MMRVTILSLLCSAGVILAGPPLAESVPADPGLCGAFPKYYKEVIYNWMKSTLVDADSAKIEWADEPKPVDIGKNGQHFYGWLVDFKVNARNRFGAYTGRQSHAALIRDNQVKQTYGFGY
jgi:hypothetical protein